MLFDKAMPTLIERNVSIAPMTDPEFERFRQYARTAIGINLQASKKAMVSSRLERVLRRNGWTGYAKYLEILSSRTCGPEWTEFIDSLTTNHTGFFRENEHFTYLQREVFPKVTGHLRIWSSACATGEEPYSLSMLAAESALKDYEILATDISRTALSEAERGTFDIGRLGGLEPAIRDRYLTLVPNSAGRTFTINERIRRNVRFQSANLLHPLDRFGRFHVVLCRNVMIYFERDVQDALIGRLVERLLPGGFLFTAHSESLLHVPPTLEYIRPAIYRRLA